MTNKIRTTTVPAADLQAGDIARTTYGMDTIGYVEDDADGNIIVHFGYNGEVHKYDPDAMVVVKDLSIEVEGQLPADWR